MRYRLRVFSAREGVRSISLEASGEQLAARSAESQGYSVLSIAPERALKSMLVARGRSFPLLLLTQQLLALLRAGLTLVEALEALAAKEHSAETKNVLDGVLAALRSGRSLSSALEQFPAAFPALYIATVRASERTSNIQDALGRYVAYQLQIEQLRKRVSGAMIYPALLIAAGALVTAFLMLYVVPRFSSLYADRGDALPALTRGLIEWGALVSAHTWEVSIALAAAAALGVSAFFQSGTRAAAAAALAKLPGVGSQLKLFRLARMYRTVGMLLAGGIPAVAALGMVGELLDADMRRALGRAIARIREGVPISQAMDEHNLTTPVSVRMLRVGEQTGNMGEMMDRVAAFYDDDLARAVELFTKTFEPALMALIGLVIGAIVILMYLPIFELASSVQ